MLFPIIKVSEKTGDEESTHIVGTNSHDRLYIDNNAIHYLNAQCMTGTQCSEESGMKFQGVESEYSISGFPEIEFVTLENLIEIAIHSMKEQTENTIETRKMISKYIEEKKRCKQKLTECEKETGITSDTSGNLF